LDPPPEGVNLFLYC